MPHLATNRPRMHLRGYELANVLCYLLGGAIFIPGSVLFLPQFEDHVAIGAVLFVAGSVAYLIVSAHDLWEITAHMNASLRELAKYHKLSLHELMAEKWARTHKWKIIEYIVANLYTLGSAIFIVGSIFFIPAIEESNPENIGTWLFIVGSLIFMAGAVINMLQLYTVTSPLSIQLLNAIAVQFLLGSTFYLIGSIIYLLPWGDDDQASSVAYAFAAWMFIIGSCLFFTGGIANWIRIRSARIAHETLGGAESIMKQKQALKFVVDELLDGNTSAEKHNGKIGTHIDRAMDPESSQVSQQLQPMSAARTNGNGAISSHTHV